MNRIATVDLADLRIDSESFLGQAVALGTRFSKLPDGYTEGLRFFLQAAGTTYARKYRTGIAVDRSALAEGVRQAVTALELGLTTSSSGDLNKAVDLLAKGDLESLRGVGYERAWERLVEMRDGAKRALDRRELSLLGPAWRDLKRWARITPDSWQVPVEEGDDTPPGVDPMREYAAFERICGQLDFLMRLPGGVLKALQSSGGNCLFEDALRRTIPPLAMDRDRIGDESSDAEDFRAACCVDGMPRAEVRDKVVGLLDSHLAASVSSEWVRDEIRELFLVELADLANPVEAETDLTE